MRPEEKFAKLLLEKHRLTPPVDVEALLRRYADLEFDRFPSGPDGRRLADAICEKRRDARPLVVVHRTPANPRLRFTLAHELGHVIIPWHVGILAEPVGFLSRDNDNEEPLGATSDAEHEANRFAAELLMPTDFTRALCRDFPPSDAVAELIRRTDVSTQAALIRALPFLPTGTLLAMADPGRGVHWTRRTPGTPIAPVANGSHPSHRLLPDADQAGSAVLPDGRTLWFWRFGMPRPLPPPGEKDWRKLVDAITADMSDVELPATRIKQSLAGVVGAVHSALIGQESEAVYGQLLLRFRLKAESDDLYRRIAAHPDFPAFVVARAHSLRP